MSLEGQHQVFKVICFKVKVSDVMEGRYQILRSEFVSTAE